MHNLSMPTQTLANKPVTWKHILILGILGCVHASAPDVELPSNSSIRGTQPPPKVNMEQKENVEQASDEDIPPFWGFYRLTVEDREPYNALCDINRGTIHESASVNLFLLAWMDSRHCTESIATLNNVTLYSDLHMVQDLTTRLWGEFRQPPIFAYVLTLLNIFFLPPFWVFLVALHTDDTIVSENWSLLRNAYTIAARGGVSALVSGYIFRYSPVYDSLRRSWVFSMQVIA